MIGLTQRSLSELQTQLQLRLERNKPTLRQDFNTSISTTYLRYYPELWNNTLLERLAIKLRTLGLYLGKPEMVLLPNRIEPEPLLPVTSNLEKAKALSKILTWYQKRLIAHYGYYHQAYTKHKQRKNNIRLGVRKTPLKWTKANIHPLITQLIDEI